MDTPAVDPVGPVGTSFWQRMKLFFVSGNYNKLIGVFVLLLIIAALPVTVFVAQQEQNLQQQAEATTYGVFVTNATTDGAIKKDTLTGTAAADAICQEAAGVRGGTWIAFLSTSSTNIRTRLPDGKFALVNSAQTIIANDKATLLSGRIAVPINVNEQGQTVSSIERVWTGSRRDGTNHDKTCNNWTSNSRRDDGHFGTTTQSNNDWVNKGNDNCDNQFRLYCVQTALPTPVTVDTPTVTVSPASSTTCPQTFNFTGTITANAAGEVTYKWIRSDGAATTPQTVTFDSAGSKTVTDIWQLGATVTAWEKLQILTPNTVESSQTNVDLTCSGGGGGNGTCTPACSTGQTCTNGQCVTDGAQSGTKINLNLNLQAIGATESGLNNTPQHLTRPVTVTVFNAGTDTQIVEGSGDISYDPNTKQFSGLIDLGTLPTGSYDIKIHTSKYLKKLLPRQVITTGTTTQMPITTLLVGDVNNDNILDILDYQLMSKQPCFGSSSPFVGGCGEGDINDDNAIGIVDLNYLLSNFGKQHGD